MRTTFDRREFLCAVSALAAIPAGAQFKRVEGTAPKTDAAGNATFRMDVDVVNVLATVRDSKGAVVSSLSREDFQVLDDGAEREIRYFARQADQPLTIGILFDTSMSQRRVLESQRDAAFQFLDRVLRPEQDTAFVIRFDADVELVQNLTASKDLLRKAISTLRTPERDRPRRNLQASPEPSNYQIRIGLPGSRRNGRFPGGGIPLPPRDGSSRRPPAGTGTLLFDAVYLAANEVLREQQGRKAILLLSDGNDYGSKLGSSAAVEEAQRADSLIYSILYADETPARADALRKRGGNALRELSGETGGAMFEVSDKHPVHWVFGQIEEELRNQYSLGFTPAFGADAEFRPIEVRVRDKKLSVRARKGYYPKAR